MKTMPWKQEVIDKYFGGLPLIVLEAEISTQSKMLYLVIHHLARSKGYSWANAKYYSTLLKMTERQYRYYRQELEAHNIIWTKENQDSASWIYPRYLIPTYVEKK